MTVAPTLLHNIASELQWFLCSTQLFQSSFSKSLIFLALSHRLLVAIFTGADCATISLLANPELAYKTVHQNCLNFLKSITECYV